tara:strand:+ start:7221 stop:7550 length:330 start_codon:yes stop_codon:yes gene_type:complete
MNPNKNGANRNSKGQFVAGNTASVGKGRPKGTLSIPDILKKIGEESGTSDGEHTKLDVVLRRVFKYAIEGKAWAVQFIADRTEGKAIERVQTQEIEPIKVLDIEGIESN